MISLRNVTKIFNQNKSNECKALNDVSLDIQKGEFVAIMGKSGSGKSTLLHIMAGLEPPTSGSVVVDGKELGKMREGELADFRNSQIGVIMQQFFLIEECTVLDNVRMPLDFSKKAVKDKNQRAIKLICQMGLENYVKKKVGELSGGEKQRVAIARALIMDAQILFADEPTGALDNENTHNIMGLLKRINGKFDKTIVIITHDQDVAKYCDRIITLNYGKIVGDYRPCDS